MKFAFEIMGPYDSKKDRAEIGSGHAMIVGVSSMEDACTTARELASDGFDCIELCGAFGPEGAKKIIEATDNKVCVGYIVHLPEQDEMYAKLFGNH